MTSHQQSSFSIFDVHGLALCQSHSDLSECDGNIGDRPYHLAHDEMFARSILGRLIDIDHETQAASGQLVDLGNARTEHVLTGKTVYGLRRGSLNMASHCISPVAKFRTGKRLHEIYGGMPFRTKQRAQPEIVIGIRHCDLLSNAGKQPLRCSVLQ